MTARHDDIVAGSTEARHWPLQPLLDASGLLAKSFAVQLGISGNTLTKAADEGLTDRQADRWAVRLGWHPMSIWGWDWIDAANKRTSARQHFAAILRDQIASGELRPGDLLPTLQQLVDQWDVSRKTASRAIADLRAEGLLSCAGRGHRSVITGLANVERAS